LAAVLVLKEAVALEAATRPRPTGASSFLPASAPKGVASALMMSAF
jgi:hypothetical protein